MDIKGYQQTFRRFRAVFCGLINWNRNYLKAFDLLLFNLVQTRIWATKYMRSRACADMCAGACTYAFDRKLVILNVLLGECFTFWIIWVQFWFSRKIGEDYGFFFSFFFFFFLLFFNTILKTLRFLEFAHLPLQSIKNINQIYPKSSIILGQFSPFKSVPTETPFFSFSARLNKVSKF